MPRGEVSFLRPHHPKFDMSVFPTVRRDGDHGDVGDVVDIRTGVNEYSGRAEIVAKSEWEFGELPDEFLCYDTKNRYPDRARERIESLYDDRILDTEKMTVYWLRWTEHIEGGDTDA